MQKISLLLFIALAISLQLSSQTVVAKYNFEGSAEDVSGNANHGIVHGAQPVTDRFGNQNKAFIFDGINDYIEVPNAESLNLGTGNFAVSFWVKTSNSTKPGMVLQKGSKSTHQAPQFWIRTPDSGYNYNLKFLTGDGNPPSPYVASDTINISDGNWHHVLAQRNEKVLLLYYDCNLIDFKEGPLRNVSDNVGIIIGAQHPHPDNSVMSNFFEGCIDDITIYNDALSFTEIQEVCQDVQSSEKTIKIEDLVSIYPNPVSEKLQIQIDETENYKVKIYDMQGRLMMQEQNQNTLDVSNLDDNIYFLKLISKERTFVYRFIKE